MGERRTSSNRRRTRTIKQEDKHDEDYQDEHLDGGDAMEFVEPKEGERHLGKRKKDYSNTKTGVRASEPFLFYQSLLLQLISNPDCEDFLKPVLEMWDENDVPNYLDRVKKPMDLGTVKENLKTEKYLNLEDGKYCFDQKACANDIRLIFENCMVYNDPHSGLHKLAHSLLKFVNRQIADREGRLARDFEQALKRAKRDKERRRRKQAEEEAASAAESARQTALALEKVKREAEEAERKRQLELHQKELEWRQRMEREKQEAVAAAVQEALRKQRVEQLQSHQHEHQHEHRESERNSRLVNTSSVSSDEQENGNGEMTFAFVSTAGMEKKRGRKSAVVTELESRHDELMKQRKAMVEVNSELSKLKQVEMTYAEKHKLCEEVAELDFVRMKAVADIVSQGMNRPDILNEVEVDIDVNVINNKVLREIQFFLQSPAATTAKDALRNIESDITEIESKLVAIRYQKVGT